MNNIGKQLIKLEKIRFYYTQSGFTLIELIITMAIFAILAVIAIPSYRQFIIKNAERNAMSNMKNLELQLESWRANRLTYKNFMPRRPDGICASGNHCYDDIDNKIIYLPSGSTSTNYRYKIELVDGSSANPSLVPTTRDLSVGRTWTMLATPNSNGMLKHAKTIKLTSTGISCAVVSNTIKISDANCGTSNKVEQW